VSQPLRQSTTATVLVGTFVDKSDGVTGETGVTLGAADSAELMKHDGTTFVDISGNGWTHKAGGMYTLGLSTTDTETTGRLTVFVADEDVCLPVWKDFVVLPANVFDSLYGSDKLQVDVSQWGGSTTDRATILTKVSQIGSISVTYSAPVAEEGEFEIYAGGDYADADGLALTETITDYTGPSLAAATCVFRLLNQPAFEGGTTVAADFKKAGSVSQDGTTVTLKVELTDTETAALNMHPPRDTEHYRYEFDVTDANSRHHKLAVGTLTVHKGQTGNPA